MINMFHICSFGETTCNVKYVCERKTNNWSLEDMK